MAEEKEEKETEEEKTICPGCNIAYIFPERGEKLCLVCETRVENKKKGIGRINW